MSGFSYEVLAEITVIYATRLDGTYQDQYFDIFIPKFIKDVKILKEETLYKILWSLVKSKRLMIDREAFLWI